MEREKKKAEVAILISDKIDFKATKTKRDKEGHYIMVKGSMQQEELMILNIYAPNTGAARYIRQVFNDLIRDLQGYPGLELRPGTSKPDRHLRNSPTQIHGIYIILSSTSHLF